MQQHSTSVLNKQQRGHSRALQQQQRLAQQQAQPSLSLRAAPPS
jgi:hypothetical protein